MLALLLAFSLSGSSVQASQSLPISIKERITRSDLVVHGIVRHLDARMEASSVGDRRIITRATVEVRTVIKGTHSDQYLEVDIVGGTLNGITLQSSAMPTMPVENEEVVLMVNQKPDGVGVLSMRGLGYFKIDPTSKQVGATKFSVDDLKTLANGGVK
jgi:hypothetical protein